MGAVHRTRRLRPTPVARRATASPRATSVRHVGVLDVAPEALVPARSRLGERANEVEWFASDVLAFESPHPWDL
jgi:hypothetical protein